MMYLCKENEDGSINDDYQEFLSNGQRMVVKDAPEPSNIIWENVATTPGRLLFNQIVSTIVIAIFLVATFFFFTWLKTRAGENLFKYPTRINCNTIRSQF